MSNVDHERVIVRMDDKTRRSFVVDGLRVTTDGWLLAASLISPQEYSAALLVQQSNDGPHPSVSRMIASVRRFLSPTYRQERLAQFRVGDVLAQLSDRPSNTIVKCEACNGRGYLDCNLGHTHVCEECEGEGEETRPPMSDIVDVAGMRINGYQLFSALSAVGPDARVNVFRLPGELFYKQPYALSLDAVDGSFTLIMLPVPESIQLARPLVL